MTLRLLVLLKGLWSTPDHEPASQRSGFESRSGLYLNCKLRGSYTSASIHNSNTRISRIEICLYIDLWSSCGDLTLVNSLNTKLLCVSCKETWKHPGLYMIHILDLWLHYKLVQYIDFCLVFSWAPKRGGNNWSDKVKGKYTHIYRVINHRTTHLFLYYRWMCNLSFSFLVGAVQDGVGAL